MIVGISGPDTTESAVVGLGNVMGKSALLFGAIFGIISMSTSFLVVGQALKEVYEYDLKQKYLVSWLLVIIPPLLILMLNLFSFIEILAVSGVMIGGIASTIIIVMNLKKNNSKLERQPEFTVSKNKIIIVIIIAILLAGMVYQLSSFF